MHTNRPVHSALLRSVPELLKRNSIGRPQTIGRNAFPNTRAERWHMLCTEYSTVYRAHINVSIGALCRNVLIGVDRCGLNNYHYSGWFTLLLMRNVNSHVRRGEVPPETDAAAAARGHQQRSRPQRQYKRTISLSLTHSLIHIHMDTTLSKSLRS